MQVGSDFKSIGAKNVMVFSDPNIAALANGPLNRALASLSAAGVVAHVFTDVSIEPTDKSFGVAVQEAKRIKPDAFLAVGGGSVMDTAKAANLYYSHPDAAFLDFVNAPVGKGLPVPGPVKPLVSDCAHWRRCCDHDVDQHMSSAMLRYRHRRQNITRLLTMQYQMLLACRVCRSPSRLQLGPDQRRLV